MFWGEKFLAQRENYVCNWVLKDLQSLWEHADTIRMQQILDILLHPPCFLFPMSAKYSAKTLQGVA